MRKRDRLKKKQRKSWIRNHPDMPKDVKEDRLANRCENCGEKMDITDDYQWAYGFCGESCGRELYGV